MSVLQFIEANVPKRKMYLQQIESVAIPDLVLALAEVAKGFSTELTGLHAESKKAQDRLRLDYEAAQERVVEQNQKLADAWNEARNKNAELEKLVTAALFARDTHAEARWAIIEAMQAVYDADMALTQHGVRISPPQ